MKANAAVTEIFSVTYMWKIAGSNTETEVPRASPISSKLIYLACFMLYPQLSPGFTTLIIFVKWVR